METSDQEKILYLVVKILSDLNIDYFITGGMAVSVWGRPRATFDIDIIVQLIEPKAVLLARAFKKISKKGYADEEMAIEAIREKGEFNFIDPDSGMKVDFWVAESNDKSVMRFENKRLKEINGNKIYFISPEDLILSKLEWRKLGAGEKHLEDIKSIFKISGGILNIQYLKKWASRLNVLSELNKLIKEPRI